MKIYTCGQRDKQASLGHPCGKAVKAVREAGYEPEIEAVAAKIVEKVSKATGGVLRG